MLERKSSTPARTARTRPAIPELVAHRGAAREFPENTLPAIKAALRAGVRWVEFDVQLCADLVPVLLHDADLRRTAGINRRVMDMALAQLQAVSVHEPQRFADRHYPTPLPMLTEAGAQLAENREAHAFVELKQESLAVFGVPTMVNAVCAALGPVQDRCVLISYHDAALAYARQRGVAGIGWILKSYDATVRARAEALAPDYLICNHTRLPAPPEPLWPGPWRWVAYEIDTPQQALELAARGVALVESFAVTELLRHPQLRGRKRVGR